MDSVFDTLLKATIPTDLYKDACFRLEQLWRHLDASLQADLQMRLAKQPELAEQLLRSILGSDYILQACCREPCLLFDNLLADAAYTAVTPLKIIDSVQTACTDSLTQPEFDRLLRRLRRRLMTALYWRDLNGLADFDEVSRAMTSMAEVFIQQALDFHYSLLLEKHGQPTGKHSGRPQPMIVLGMGKLGGGELNVSSDIDLIFAFPEAGETRVAEGAARQVKPIDNQQFFTSLGQRLIKSLSEITEEGFVFRVDMRLRPYGQSGALVCNFTALENYYEAQGRDWERYACIKARVVACSQLVNEHESIVTEREATDNLYAILTPFVYRQYIDFSMIDSLRQLKLMIEQEVRRKGMEDNIKLGKGGIREVEFIAQAIQLIRGGRDKQLQARNVLCVLDIIGAEQYLQSESVCILKTAYLFLRKTEHFIQALNDTQTQQLPTNKLDQCRLAWLMGSESWAQFLKSLMFHRDHVNQIFKTLIAPAEQDKSDAVDNNWLSLWQNLDIEYLHDNFSEDAVQIVNALAEFKNSRNVQHLSASAKEKLDIFMPLLLQTIDNLIAASSFTYYAVLQRLLIWLESIVNRTSYVVLMLENRQTLKHLVRLFAESAWVAVILKQIPSLLDELLSPEKLYSLPDKAVLRDELRQRLLRIEEDDTEANMEALRYFRLAQNLQVAACEIEGTLPLMKVSDYLTFTAEVVLEQVLLLAWCDMTQRYGYPPGATDSEPRFIIVGYGKLGGIEMSYSSDLDLVFIYDADAQAMTMGNKPIDCQTFYTRLGQKIIHFLNTRTLSGKLYEVDMRLRPSGNSGLLVSSLQAYDRYQRESAWVWEHQALVRARAIAGDAKLQVKFSRLRRAVLKQLRDAEKLKQDVRVMREKMRQHLSSSSTKSKISETLLPEGDFHLKQDAGGIVDIEFMVQYAVLAWSHQYPTLSEWTDNIRILESLQQLGLMDSVQTHQLIEIYQSYRAAGHRLALQQQTSSSIESEPFASMREQVIDLWQAWFQ